MDAVDGLEDRSAVTALLDNDGDRFFNARPEIQHANPSDFRGRCREWRKRCCQLPDVAGNPADASSKILDTDAQKGETRAKAAKTSTKPCMTRLAIFKRLIRGDTPR